MEIIRKLASGALVVFGILVIAFFIIEVVKTSNSAVNRDLDDQISATLSNPHLTRVPHGPAVRDFYPGDQIFFSLDVTRPEGCFIDSSFRFARIDAEDAHTVWPVDGSRVYAPPMDHVDHLSYSVSSPNTLIPGDYKLTRSTAWQCGDREKAIMNVMTLDLRILPKGTPLEN